MKELKVNERIEYALQQTDLKYRLKILQDICHAVRTPMRAKINVLIEHTQEAMQAE